LLECLENNPQMAGVQPLTILRTPQNYWEQTTKYIFKELLNIIGPADIIGTPCIFRRSSVKKVQYDEVIRGGCDDTDLCLRLCQAGYTLEKINVPSYEEQPLNFSGFVKRWQFYGKGDAQFYNKYQAQWSTQRKVFSLLHPARKYFGQGTFRFLEIGRPELIPALWIGAIARYIGWLQEAKGS